MNKKNILNFIIIFLLVYLSFQLFFNQNQSKTVPTDIAITSTKQQFSNNETIAVKIANHSDAPLTLHDDCPREPFTVLFYKNGEWITKEYTAQIACPENKTITIPAQQEQEIKYQYWSHALFNELGRYKIVAEIGSSETVVNSEQTQQTTETITQQTTETTTQQSASQEQTQSTSTQQGTQQLENELPQPPPQPQVKTIESNEFEITEPGIFSKIWTSIFYQPIYNTLIFLASIVPYHDFGLAIILLTILIRTILLIPSQKGLKSQRKLQEIQPKIAKLKEKHKDNQEMIAKETMALWKEHKINPLGGCLPILIQFPVLIALFYVIQDGLNPNNTYLLYEPLKNFPLASIHLNFLGILDLSKINFIALPLIVGGLQFFQMKLAMMRTKKQEKNKAQEGKKEEKEKSMKNEMQMANQMMIYVMPVMIAIFTASVPAGVGLYWSTSTIYGIIQQLVVNKQVAEETASVKVIEKKKEKKGGSAHS